MTDCASDMNVRPARGKVKGASVCGLWTCRLKVTLSAAQIGQRCFRMWMTEKVGTRGYKVERFMELICKIPVGDVHCTNKSPSLVFFSATCLLSPSSASFHSTLLQLMSLATSIWTLCLNLQNIWNTSMSVWYSFITTNPDSLFTCSYFFASPELTPSTKQVSCSKR